MAAHVRRYYIAAEPTVWNYAPLDYDPTANKPLPAPWNSNPSYAKYRYFQYTDATFTKRVPQAPWLGILGPVIHAVVGDTIVVTFLNRTDRPLSMHPHGVTYDKDDEGAYYYPNPGRGAAVAPGSEFTYVWHASKSSGPQPGEPSSKVWLYHSHVQGDVEINLGLVGAIIITDPKFARPDGTPADVDREFVTLFTIFHEDAGLKGEMSMGMGDDDEPDKRVELQAFNAMTADQQQNYLNSLQKYAINGMTFGNLPGLDCRVGEHVRWYLMALGSESDLHSPHWHGETVVANRSRTDVVELLPASMKVADMVADNPGSWLFHCHVAEHMMSGMYTQYRVLPHSGRVPAEWTGDGDPKSLTVMPASGLKIIGNVGACHDFGTVSPISANQLSYTFELRNSSYRPLDIDRLVVPTSCTAAFVESGSQQMHLLPGQTAHVKVVLDVQSMPDGEFFKNIPVFLSGAMVREVELDLMGELAPPVIVQPASYSFNQVRPGKSPYVDVVMSVDKSIAVKQWKTDLTDLPPGVTVTRVTALPARGSTPRDERYRDFVYRLQVSPVASIGSLEAAVTTESTNPVLAARISNELSEPGTFILLHGYVVGDFSASQDGVAFGSCSKTDSPTFKLSLTGFNPHALDGVQIRCDDPSVKIAVSVSTKSPADRDVVLTLDPSHLSGQLSANVTILAKSGARAVLPVVAYVQ